MSELTDFKTLFPQFDAALVDAAFPALLNLRILYYPSVYGGSQNTNTAILYLIAHLFVVDQTPSDTQINQLSSSATDSVSGSFRFKQDTSDFISFFSATKYGQQFLQAIKKRQGGFFI